MVGFITQCRVQRCSRCQGSTEFYCNTCKYNLCLQCKERHVVDLGTKYHDVVIYCEKYEYIPKQEMCARHPGKSYEMFCHTCELPVCFQCKEHRKHKILGIGTTYKTNRQQCRKILHNTRSETLYNSCSLLAGIIADINTCHIETSNRQSEVSKKAQRLNDLFDTVICDVLCHITQRLPEQKRKMNIHIANIENYEYRFEQTANRPVKFLFFLKKSRVPKEKDTPKLTQHILFSLTEEISKKDLIILLSGFQLIERGKRQVSNGFLLKLMSAPMLHRYVTVTDLSDLRHISCVTAERVWISDYQNLILMNTSGNLLHRMTDRRSLWGEHTMNNACHLIYIDRDYNINKLSKDNKTRSTLIKKTGPWIPRCVYCTPSNGDLLVGMWNTDTNTGTVIRYKDTQQHIQRIKHNKTGFILNSYPRYITENINGDVIVSNRDVVVVTEHQGRHRFTYKGPPSGSGLWAWGICTDVLSNILVCDWNTRAVQIIDKDGQFLSLIQTEEHGINRPASLSYDYNTHLLLVGSWDSNKVCVYSYIARQDYLTG